MCECLTTAGDEIDNTVLALFGHRPQCSEFKFKKKEFSENFRYLIERAADRLLVKELPKLRSELEKEFIPRQKILDEKLSEAKVQLGLHSHLGAKGHKIIAPNIEIFYTGEMDVCSIMKTGMVCEYEIKLSRADFKADFKKEHKHPVFHKRLEGIDHELKSGYSGAYVYRVEYTAPNFYYYVVPKNLIKVEEIPVYAGLITFPPNNIFAMETVKRAKKLHNNPISPEKMSLITEKLMWRCWSAKQKIFELENKLSYQIRKMGDAFK